MKRLFSSELDLRFLSYGEQQGEREQVDSIVTLLNNPDYFDISSLVEESCSQIVYCDGGYLKRGDFGLKDTLLNSLNIKETVVGDFDSFNQSEQGDIRKGVDINHSPDQDFHDFEKSLNFIRAENPNTDLIIAVGVIGSRFDHTMNNINSLFAHQSNPDSKIPIIGLSKHTLSIPIGKGETILTLPSSIVEHTGLGLIPFGTEITKTTTEGLLWDLTQDMVTGFGTMLSTSNGISPTNKERIVKIDNQGDSFLLSIHLQQA